MILSFGIFHYHLKPYLISIDHHNNYIRKFLYFLLCLLRNKPSSICNSGLPSAIFKSQPLSSIAVWISIGILRGATIHWRIALICSIEFSWKKIIQWANRSEYLCKVWGCIQANGRFSVRRSNKNKISSVSCDSSCSSEYRGRWDLESTVTA